MKKSQAQSKNSIDDSELPWWVELLFVQIGLPDNWLRTYLKKRKAFRIFFKNNNVLIKYLFIILIGILYIDPIVKESRIFNYCIKGSQNIIKAYTNENTYSEKEYKVLATRYCNGGNIK